MTPGCLNVSRSDQTKQPDSRLNPNWSDYCNQTHLPRNITATCNEYTYEHKLICEWSTRQLLIMLLTKRDIAMLILFCNKLLIIKYWVICTGIHIRKSIMYIVYFCVVLYSKQCCFRVIYILHSYLLIFWMIFYLYI